MSSLFDYINETPETSFMHEAKVVTGAIYEIYKEADKKREELLKTVDKDIAKYTLPSYRDLRNVLSEDRDFYYIPSNNHEHIR